MCVAPWVEDCPLSCTNAPAFQTPRGGDKVASDVGDVFLCRLAVVAFGRCSNVRCL